MNRGNIPLSDEDFNNLKWERHQATELMKELQGYTVSGIEPMIDGFRNNSENDPVIGGIELYLTRSDSKQIKVISLFSEIFPLDDEEDTLKMDVAYCEPAHQ